MNIRILTTMLVALALSVAILATSALADTMPVGIKTNTGSVPDLAPLWRLFYADSGAATVLRNPTSLTEFDVFATIPASGVLNPNVKFRLEASGTLTATPLGANAQLAILVGSSTIGITPAMHISSETTSKTWTMITEFEPRTVGSSGTIFARTSTTIMGTATNGTTPTFNVTSTGSLGTLPTANWTSANTVKIQAKMAAGVTGTSAFELDSYKLYVIEK